MADGGDLLHRLAARLREEGTVISSHVVEPSEPAALGALAEAMLGADGAVPFAVECVREGYLLHYGTPRVLAGLDPELALLAGDYLYAMALAALAEEGALEAISELADLIALAAQLHESEEHPPGAAAALWIASTVAISSGAGEGYARAKSDLRNGGSARGMAAAAAERAAAAGARRQVAEASEAVGFPIPNG